MTGDGRRRRTGSLQCERGGVWTMRVMLGGRMYSRTAGTKDRGEAETELSKFVAALEREHDVGPEPGALLEEWPRYESSAEAARLSPGFRANRRRVWRSFSAWMAAVNPGVASAGEVTGRMAESYMDFFGERRLFSTRFRLRLKEFVGMVRHEPCHEQGCRGNQHHDEPDFEIGDKHERNRA